MRKSLCIIVITLSLIVLYNGLFLRTQLTYDFLEHINPLPYAAHFASEKEQPHAIFQTPVFPQYNEYCFLHHTPCQFIPFQQLYADALWINSIQYIGLQTDISHNKGLFTLLDTLTTLSPFRTYPYTFGELVIPMQRNPLQRATSGEDMLVIKKQSWEDAIRLAEKGEKFLCNQSKLEAIKNNSKFGMLNSKGNSKLNPPAPTLVGDTSFAKEASTVDISNPCATYELPHYMAFNYFYFLGDAEKAAEQYRISSLHEDAPALTATMAALVYGRGGEHLKSATLWYDRYISLKNQEEDQTSIHTQEDYAPSKKTLEKAVFELQLQLITEAAEKHTECGTSYACLQKIGAIEASIYHSRNDLCQGGKNTQNIRCIVLTEGVAQKYIGLDGTLVYPIESGFEFAWSQDYKSRWAQPSSNHKAEIIKQK